MPQIAERGGVCAFIGEAVFTYSTALIKISILIFHRRLIIRSENRVLLWAIWAAIGFTIAYSVGLTMYLLFICSPISASWKSLNILYTQPYKCGYRGYLDPMWGVLSVASDIYAIVLPELFIRKLQVTWKQKLALSFIFGCGLLWVFPFAHLGL